MKILSFDPEPLARIVYFNASPSGGRETKSLAIERAIVDELPESIEALLVASDLQGVVIDWKRGGESVLLGVQLADAVADLANKHGVPALSNMGAILAGDLYSSPDGTERGASGDVRSVWEAFSENFGWVVGVQGNHDSFGTAEERAQLVDKKGIHLLDGDIVELGGISFGGVGLIMGNPNKHGRRSDGEFLELLDLVTSCRPDVMILHQGPHGDREQRGDALIRQTLIEQNIPLTICGHRHWEGALHAPSKSVQFLNVDKRAVLLQVQQG